MNTVHTYLSCVFYLAVIRTSLCNATSIGDKLEVFNLTTPGDAYSMVPDLAIHGNILVSTSPHDKLYTTDMVNATELTTESKLNITYMPPFVQTSAGGFVYVVDPMDHAYYIRELCFCHLSRDSAPSAIYASMHDVCELLCKLIQSINYNTRTRPVVVKLDERYSDLGYVISDLRSTEVIFFNLSNSFTYEGRRQLNQNISDDILNGEDSATTVFPINLRRNGRVKHISAVQDGDVTYLVYGHSIYRMDMPSASSLQSRSVTELTVLWVSGGKNQNFLDTDFASAEYYYSLRSVVRINSTMLAVADLDNNRIKLLDLKKNVTLSLCVIGSALNTCPILKPRALLFVNNSLYVQWTGGYGRIYHSAEKSSLSAQVEQATRSPIDINIIISVAIPIAVLVTAAVAAFSISMWRRNHSSLRTRGSPERESREVCDLEDRPLPSISAGLEDGVAEEESYDMPEIDQEDVYAMIGDQYYDTLDLCREQITTCEASKTHETDMTGPDDPQNIPDRGYYGDCFHIEQSYSSSGTQRNDVRDSVLDKYGYLKPTPTSDRLTL